MLYENRQAFLDAPNKRIAFIGMSGLGKTYISNMLRETGNWFHYSVDYRIGTRYMGEPIVDNFKREAMKVPFLREMLMSDSIHIGSNITFNNLAPLSAYLGKPGDIERGGISYDEYMRRQEVHRQAEIDASCDAVQFIEKAQSIYDYDNFICDTSGSICEVVDPGNPDDPVLKTLSENMLIIWIKGSDSHINTLVERFDKAPKPMYTRADAMDRRWGEYLSATGLEPDAVNPDDFIRWSYRQILDDRGPMYQEIAENWGITVEADAFASARNSDDVLNAIAAALPA